MAPGLQSIALFSQIVVDHAKGCTITDVDGNEYLDFIAGIAVGSVGHSHPHYVKRLKEQLERVTFGSFTTETRARFLNLVSSLLPEGITHLQLFSGGAEAVEAAFRLAKSVTKKFEFIGFWGGFHGKSAGRHRHARRRLSQPSGAVSARHASFALCELLPLPVEPATSVLRPGLRRASAQRHQERHARRGCGDHHRADAGHGRQRDPARRLHSRRARDRRRVRRAAHRRRNPDRLRPHRERCGPPNNSVSSPTS